MARRTRTPTTKERLETTVPEMMKGFTRGALPPQGLESFIKQFRSTFSGISDVYVNAFRQQTNSAGQFVDTMLPKKIHPKKPKAKSVPAVASEFVEEKKPAPKPAPAPQKQAEPAKAPAASEKPDKEEKTASSEPTEATTTTLSADEELENEIEEDFERELQEDQENGENKND